MFICIMSLGGEYSSHRFTDKERKLAPSALEGSNPLWIDRRYSCAILFTSSRTTQTG